MNLCLAPYGDTYLYCTDAAGHAGDHTAPTGDGDGVWAWTQVHHPSCPARHLVDAGGPYLASACLCGPEAVAEDAVLMAERTPDTMLLDVVAHADAAMAHPLDRHGPVARRLILAQYRTAGL